MIEVKMSDKDVVDLVHRDARSHIVRDRALADVEDKILSVAELYEDRRIHLARTDRGSRAHENDADLVWLDIFRIGKPI